MLDEQAKENVRKDIQTILKTAIVVDSTLDEYGSELCERLERTAEALQKTFEMEDSLMEDFRKALETAREQNSGEPEDFCAPCGVCRQVMMEFCDPKAFRVILGKKDLEYREYTLEEILPLGFAGEEVNRK